MSVEASKAVGTKVAQGEAATETALLERAKEGDADAFRLLVIRYQDRVYSMILRMVTNADDAQDLTQEVFLTVCSKIASFRGRSQFYTWLYRVAANKSLSHLRKRKTSREVPDPVESTHRPDTHGDAPSARLEKGERAVRVERALARLEPDMRAVVILRDIEDMSYDRIADVLGIREGTVKSRLHRGRETLREMLKELVS